MATMESDISYSVESAYQVTPPEQGDMLMAFQTANYSVKMHPIGAIIGHLGLTQIGGGLRFNLSCASILST